MKVPYTAEMTGSRKNRIQIGEACSLRSSARKQRKNMAHTSFSRTARQANAKNAAASTTTHASSSGRNARMP